MYGKSVGLFSYRLGDVRYYSQKGSSKKLLEFLASMPKSNSGRLADAQRARLVSQKKAEKYGPSTIYLQVLGSGARGVPNTLYLFTDQKRYMFNCGECTQRLAHEHKVKLSKLEHIFITSKTWKNIGGLPGLSLTLQDVGVPNITLHGPKGLDELYNATRRFVIMKDMSVTMAPCSPTTDFEDSVMTVKYVLMGPHLDVLKKETPPAKRPKLSDSPDKEFEKFMNDDTDYYSREAAPSVKVGERRFKAQGKTSPEKDVNKKVSKVLQELHKMSNCSVAYICTLKKRMGTLDLAKCVELGVKPGPQLGQLKSGVDVLLPSGKLVQARQVKTPDDPGPVFIVLEVPQLDYLHENEFQAHFAEHANPPESVPAVVVHYTPPHILSTPRYRAFMARFGPTTRHLILNEQNACMGSEAVHRTQHKLHLLDPDIFPLLRDASIPPIWNAQPPVPKTTSPMRLRGLEELKKKFQSIVTMESPCKGDAQPTDPETLVTTDPKGESVTPRSLTVVHLRPKKDIDRSHEPKLHIQDYIQEAMDVDGFNQSLEAFRTIVDTMRYEKKGEQPEYPKVVFLGTGSCIPSKTRNTSCIVMHIDNQNAMLMDCGEGTYGQLVRFYGPKKVNAFLRSLKAIYVSHLHADHHIGLIGVLQARRQAFEEIDEPAPAPVVLFAPGQILCWLTMYERLFEPLQREFTLVPNQDLLYDAPAPQSHMTSALLASTGLRDIKTCYVTHCPNAFGVCVTVGDDHKITYSGDTVPCDELVQLGEGSTLLIHEATMEDELADEARMKMHSTTSQAIRIGERMHAQYTVLTHFSQRYARLPRLNPHILTDNARVGIAFDNMQISMSDLKLLPQMYAPLQLMFAEHCVEMELKAALRARNKDKSKSVTRPQTPKLLRSPARSPDRQKYPGLRQEMKGMELAGVIRRLRTTSERGPPPHRESNPTATSYSINVSGSPSTTLQHSNVSRIPRPPSHLPSTSKQTIPQGSEAKRTPSKETYTLDSKSGLSNTKLTSEQERTFFMNTIGKTVWTKKAEEGLGNRHAPERRGYKGKQIKQDVLDVLLPQEPLYKSTPQGQSGFSNYDKSKLSLTLINSTSSTEAQLKQNKKQLDSSCKPKPAKGTKPSSFKPLLEDIKSSLILLNHKPDLEQNKPAPRPKALDDEARKRLLLKSKQMYRTKKFWKESKYDKIEGLNWISWK